MTSLARPPRPACPRCSRPLAACLCAWAMPTDNRLPLLVLQHPAEAAHAKNSVRLLRLGLSACRVEVAAPTAAGTGFDATALAGWLAVPGGSLLLFPDALSRGRAAAGPDPLAGPGSAPAPDPGLGAPPALPHPGQLVLIDGTWRQARALLRAHPLLQFLPRLALTDPPPSAYLHRRAHRQAQRSTLEAACLALGWIEGRPAHYAPMLAGFRQWAVAEQARAGHASGPGAGLAPGAAISAPAGRS